MAISLKTHKMLWGRAAERCEFPDCRRKLSEDETETDDPSLVGDACHIVAESKSGPRGEITLSPEHYDKYDNLILLCKVHHKIIDDQTSTYSLEKLKEMKTAHEKWVVESLKEFDAAKQRDNEIYSMYIDRWFELATLDNWLNWSSYVLEFGGSSMTTTKKDDLDELATWLFSRIWPKRYPELEATFENFRRVLTDFLNTFNKHAIKAGREEEKLITEKFYKINEWNPSLYENLSNEYDFHVRLVMDLMLELTRAANYICDKIREFISPIFRIKEGILIVEAGLFMDLSIKRYRTEYRGDERKTFPYPGLEQFLADRSGRDFCFGENSK